MRISATFLLFAHLFFEHASAAKVFSLDIARTASPAAPLGRRANGESFPLILQNGGAGNFYTASIDVGTPPQKLTLAVDTGSTDIWFVSSNSSICKQQSCAGGSFDMSQSSTIGSVEPGNRSFNITYQDMSGATGEYITDVLSVGGKTIPDMQMGLAFKSSNSFGILGLSFDNHEAANTTYPSFVDQLVNHSYINSKAYSMYLNDVEASTGTILFGGIDTEKYIGDLAILPLIPDIELATPQYPKGVVISFEVVMNSISVTGEAGNSTTFALSSTASDGSTTPAVPALLDSGTTLTYLPPNAIAGIYKLLGAVNSSTSIYDVFVDCDILTSQPHLTVDFQFGSFAPNTNTSTTIRVPITELVFTLTESPPLGSSVQDLPFANTCIMGVLDSTSIGGATILGDTFLRSAYVVFDLANAEVGMAQTNFNATAENVVEITGEGIPVVRGVSAASSSTSSATMTVSSTATMGSATTTMGPSVTSGGVAPATSSPGAAADRLLDSSRKPWVLLVSSLVSLVGGAWLLI